MKRRSFLAGSAAVLAAPCIGRGAEARVLKFIPQADPTILDPIWTTAYVTRNHGYMIFDTLYGIDNAYRPQPQMVAGHVVENDGKAWKLTLRDGLMWHDGENVLARDCVASIERWGKRDPFGQTHMGCSSSRLIYGACIFLLAADPRLEPALLCGRRSPHPLTFGRAPGPAPRSLIL